jgi:hypothetical protein
MAGDAEIFERFHLTDREGNHGIIGIGERNGRPLHERILGDHHVMTLVIIDGKTPLITVYCHLFQQPLQVGF